MAFKWTELEFTEVKRLYAAGQSLEDIQALNPTKSVASIRMKLVKAGVYEKAGKPTATTKTATKAPTTKSEVKAANKLAWDLVGPALL